MKKETIVIALGGNALGHDPKEQMNILQQTAKPIAALIENGYNVVITHGNGYQVGIINSCFSYAWEKDKISSAMPFPECGAMSQGYIAYQLQLSLKNELTKRNINKDVISIITQTLVDKNDPAFNTPTKPIGDFYTKQAAQKLIEGSGFTMFEDSGRGYRRLIASPKPIDIIEKNTIKALADNGTCVICSGGGGIPVIQTDNGLEGIAAVIDKDFAAAKTAELINADKLVILTAVPNVMLNWGTSKQKSIESMSVSQAIQYCNENQFGRGSMLPKVQAAIFATEKGIKSVIASLDNAAEALIGKSGTRIYN